MGFLKSFFLSILLSFSSLSAVEPSEKEPVVILGGGVGATTSALYLARAGYSPLVIEGPHPGGLLTQSHAIQNWPGVLETDGLSLMEKMKHQAVVNGARFVKEEVTEVDFSKKPFLIQTRDLETGAARSYSSESCIIAMGTKPNFLGVPGEQKYWGQGVSNCAICDGSLYKNKVVGIVGGGDSAVLEALYLSKIAKEVNLFVRKSALQAHEQKRVHSLMELENVHIFYDTEVHEIQGNQSGVTQVILQQNKQLKPFHLDGLFLAIGSTPNTSLFKKFLKLDKKGYIVLKKDQMTSVDGVYGIGDIVDPFYKQAVSASGDGAKAALQVQHQLSDQPLQIVQKKAAEKQEMRPEKQVIEVASSEQFYREIASGQTPVVVDFYATWCGPCKRVSPILEASAHHLTGKVKFLKVNVDKFKDLSSSFHIRSMPTVLLFDSSGEEKMRKVGFDQIQDLLNQLEKKD